MENNDRNAVFSITAVMFTVFFAFFGGAMLTRSLRSELVPTLPIPGPVPIPVPAYPTGVGATLIGVFGDQALENGMTQAELLEWGNQITTDPRTIRPFLIGVGVIPSRR